MVATAGTRATAGERTEQLTLEQVVAAGERLAERVGFDRLTMRAVAQELGVTTMAPYHYVHSKQELVALIAESIHSQVQIPDRDSGDWKDRIRALFRSQDANLRQHQRTMAFVIDVEPSPAIQRIGDAINEIMRDAGLPEEEALMAGSILYFYWFGRIVVGSGMVNQSLTSRGRKSHKTATTSPATLGWLNAMSSERYGEYALETVIAGIEAALAVARPQARGDSA